MGADQVPDSEAFERVQRANQARVMAKLLHDLRNPVHSVRIVLELVGRLVQPGVDPAALLDKVRRYAPAAETAVTALSAQVERLGVYASPPRRPSPQPVLVGQWLAEITLLARESTAPRELEVQSSVPEDAVLLADRPRLSHAFLAWVLQDPSPSPALRVHEESGGVCLESGAPLTSCGASIDVRLLLESAGGRFANDGEMRVLFSRGGEYGRPAPDSLLKV